ncbi:MAG: segregation/condensation protein A, partial [Oscillospiraceae bacterium]|nr:segregation/condensation protein A [Oscillospiraceae bacterium]
MIDFKLEQFTGPLDLLLSLISKHKLNILDIQISILLEQYLEYLEQLQQLDYEDIGNFLEMASRLIYIKTISLLPKSEEAKEEKKRLSRELVEYAEVKRIAALLKEIYTDDIFSRESVKIDFPKSYTRI